MQQTFFFLWGTLLSGVIFGIFKLFRKTSDQEKFKLEQLNKRRKFLKEKVFKLFEVEEKHHQDLIALTGEIEQLQRDLVVHHHKLPPQK